MGRLEKLKEEEKVASDALTIETDRNNALFDVAEAAVKKLTNGEAPDANFVGMSADALEWQYLGLKLIEILIKNDDDYQDGNVAR
jgi:hypothetical protein